MGSLSIGGFLAAGGAAAGAAAKLGGTSSGGSGGGSSDGVDKPSKEDSAVHISSPPDDASLSHENARDEKRREDHAKSAAELMRMHEKNAWK